MIMKTKLIFILFVLIICSCVRIIPDEELTMSRIPYTGNEIRLDGYFTGIQPGQKMYYNYIFFYSNGVVFSFGNLRDIDLTPYLKGSAGKAYWGIFQVKNNIIHNQGWINTGSGFIGDIQINTVYDRYYKIINDTTLFDKNSSGDTTRYHFKRLSPKPDSTNVFIK